MCTICDQLAVAVELEAATLELIAAEQAAGLSPSNATRALFAHEYAAHARFAELEDGLDAAVTEVTDLIDGAQDDLREALLDELFPDGASRDPALVLAGLATLQATQPGVVKRILDALTSALEAVFSRMFDWAAGMAAAEAARQGVTRRPQLPTVDPAKVAPMAQATALRSWQWLLHKTQEQVGAPSSLMSEELTREEITKIVEKIETKGAVDQARQSIHTAAGSGRVETIEAYEPTQIWASELLDGATCPACYDVDGKEYEDMIHAMEDYPYGYYKGCRGDSRCRGTIVALYDE